jgi:prepilin-type N-terminal cleavage/methylation domain-containing protein/prepilin-type processing-associated H-X9-DG protein
MSRRLSRSHPNRSCSKGFTLVELLVVIGIIALLISILLPSLAKARRAAQTIACAANLRSIVQGMQIYAAQNNGYIAGSPCTTGRFIYSDLQKGTPDMNYSNSFCPNIIQAADWASPIAKIMGVKFPEGPLPADRAQRYIIMRELPQFKCPSNDILAQQFGTSLPTNLVPIGPMVSYNTAMGFLTLPNPGGAITSVPPVNYTVSRPDWAVPAGYNIKVVKVGDPARKVYIADGAKFSTGRGSGGGAADTQPDADLSWNGQLGGSFSDQGPNFFTRAWNRAGVAENNNPGALDCRIFWARHGPAGAKQGSKKGTFRANCGFFDGHVETLDDIQAANPTMWWPKGTFLSVAKNNQEWTDVYDAYKLPTSGFINSLP